MIVILGQLMTIHYIGRHAPKGRPLNNMILVDQVSEKYKPQSQYPCGLLFMTLAFQMEQCEFESDAR